MNSDTAAMERERKRKLPARAARVEQVSKKRTSTPPEPRAQTQPTPPPPAPVVEEALPKSITNGKPLPTIDEPQPDDLPAKEFQTISERCVPMSFVAYYFLVPSKLT